MMSRALLVIDVQNEYFSGALPITYPNNHLAGIVKAIDAANSAKTPVVLIRHAFADPKMGIFQHGTDAWKLHPEVADCRHDAIIDKSLPGSFTGTNLDAWLRERGIDTVTISGYMTHMCCDTTAREAMHRNYKVEFLSDATGTLPLDNAGGKVTAEELHRAVLAAQQMMISEVLPVERWIESKIGL
jgi:nicotinamidase-related amidase